MIMIGGIYHRAVVYVSAGHSSRADGENMSRDVHDSWDIALGPLFMYRQDIAFGLWDTLEVPDMNHDVHHRADSFIILTLTLDYRLPPNPLEKASTKVMTSI